MEDSTTEKTRVSVDKKIDNFIEEGLGHAAEMLFVLWETVSKEGDIKPLVDISPTVSSFQFCLLARALRECSLRITRLHRSRAPYTGPL